MASKSDGHYSICKAPICQGVRINTRYNLLCAILPYVTESLNINFRLRHLFVRLRAFSLFSLFSLAILNSTILSMMITHEIVPDARPWINKLYGCNAHPWMSALIGGPCHPSHQSTWFSPFELRECTLRLDFPSG